MKETRSGMITVILAKPGHGKSLFACWLMGQYVAAGRAVATNIRLKPACPFQSRVVYLDDESVDFPVFRFPEPASDKRPAQTYRAWWHYMPRGFCYFIDEGDNYFDSMDFGRLSNVGTDARLYFKQHRKRKDDIFLIVQDLDNLWNRIRRMVQKFVVCEDMLRARPFMKYLPEDWAAFVRAEFSHQSLKREFMSGEGYLKRSEARVVYDWYDTDQLVGDPVNYNWAQNEVKHGHGIGRVDPVGASGRVGESTENRGEPRSAGAATSPLG